MVAFYLTQQWLPSTQHNYGYLPYSTTMVTFHTAQLWLPSIQHNYGYLPYSTTMHGYLLYSTTTHGYLPYLYKFACELTVQCRTPKRAQTADHLLWTMSTHRWCVQIHGSSTVTGVSVETKLAVVRHSDQVLKSLTSEEVNTHYFDLFSMKHLSSVFKDGGRQNTDVWQNSMPCYLFVNENNTSTDNKNNVVKTKAFSGILTPNSTLLSVNVINKGLLVAYRTRFLWWLP